MKRPKRLRFDAFCEALKAALNRQHPGWRARFGELELKRWVGQRWPVPPAAVLSPRVWACCCYRQLTDSDLHSLAS
jgi:hypothetical protein